MKNLYRVISRRITIIIIAFLLTYVPSCAIGVTSAVTSTKESGNAPTSERTASTTATFPLDGTEIIRTVTPTHLISTPTLAASDSTVLVGINILLLEGTGTGMYYLFDLDRGSGRYLITERDLIIQVVDWTRDGCSLIVLLSNGEIVEIDLSGKILRSFFSKDLIPAQDQPEVKTLPDISPSKDWIAYRIVSGEPSVDPQTMQERYAVQELYTIQINNYFGKQVV